VSETGHILAIEISNPSAAGEAGSGPGVCIGIMTPGGVEVLGVEPVSVGARGGHDDDLMPAIDRVCRRTGFDVRARGLARVAVSIGPGGYTSLRVACAAGKMIAEGAGAKCAAVPTARVVLEALPANLRAGTVGVALASKGESAWVEVFRGGTASGPGRLMSAPDIAGLPAAGVQRLLADQFLPASMRRAAEEAGIQITPPVFDAAACARVGASMPAIDPVELVPLYPREPDAVTLWRARKW